ncbi:LOW QUALITY PROTEIN: arylacetamide deacetylase-like 4 [Morus bassanus]
MKCQRGFWREDEAFEPETHEPEERVKAKVLPVKGKFLSDITGPSVSPETLAAYSGIHERICWYIPRKSDSVAVSVGYHFSPEHKSPAQTVGCLTAAVRFLKTAENYGVDPDQIIVWGGSAGGTLTASKFYQIVKFSFCPKATRPGTDLQTSNSNLPSHQKNAFIALLSREHTVRFISKYLRKDCSMKEGLAGSHLPEGMNLKYRKWINPDLTPEILKLDYKPPSPTSFLPHAHEETKELFETRLPPLLAADAVVCRPPDTCIITREHDVLRDDGLLYEKRLEDNNVKVTWYHMEEGFHRALGFFGYGIFSLPSSSKTANHTVNFIKGC